MNEVKNKLSEILKGCKIATIAIETIKMRTVHVCIGDAIVEVRAKAKRALEAGHSVTWEDGRTQWVETEPLFGSDESGGWYWHKDHNRIKCEKRLHTKTKDGKITVEVLKTIWLDYERAMRFD